MNIKLVKEASTVTSRWRNDLVRGTAFRYVNDQSPCIKTDIGHVDLSTGMHWSDAENGKVIVLDATFSYKDKM